MKRLWLFGGLAAVVLLAACSGSAEPAPAEAAPSAQSGGEARTLPIPSVGGAAGADTAAEAHGPLTWDKPASWNAVQPSSSMRVAQYEVPGSGGDGELAVFYFGPGQGGPPEANAARWARQFAQPDGGDPVAAMKMEDIAGGNLPLQLVEVTGTYDGGMTMTAAPAEAKEGWMLLGGIAHGPDAPWFFKLTGPQATLEENRDAFVAMLRSIRQEI